VIGWKKERGMGMIGRMGKKEQYRGMVTYLNGVHWKLLGYFCNYWGM